MYNTQVHGGDSPVECGECGELCWSREGLRAHAAARHPHVRAPAPAPKREPSYDDCNSGIIYLVLRYSGVNSIIIILFTNFL